MTARHMPRTAQPGTAALPMYDWPELAGPMDRLWHCIAAALGDAGLQAPPRLNRSLPYDGAWLRDDLLLGQTCGLPLATALAGRVGVVGTFDLGLPGCPFGHYRSALLVREDSDIASLEQARGARLSINNLDSQSGFHSIIEALPDEAAPFFGAVSVSGAHRRSIERLLDGEVDIAAIDTHALRLAERFGPTSEGLRTIGFTRACPGTPLITSRHHDAMRIADAVERALAQLDGVSRSALGITGLWRCSASDYTAMADAGVAARAQRERA